ncbi:MAG: IS1182 family transposase [Bacillota bacterium]
MSRYIRGVNRDQLNIFPICLDDMIAEDNVVRAIDAIVDNMDISSIGFTHSETKETGRKPYSPADLFKLYTYSYFNGIRSSRKIEKECHRNIEVMWLINELKPDFKTIADFRKDNKKQVKLAFSKFSMICDELGLIGKEIIAVDGSKFRANNGRKAYHTEKKLQKTIEYYTQSADKYITLLDRCDSDESGTQTTNLSKAEIKAKIRGIHEHLAELKALETQVKQNGPIYKSDSDSRMMRTNNNGGDICHNVQIAVDDKAHLIIAVDVTSEPVDKQQFHNITPQAKAELGVESITAIADKGYYSASEFAKCKEDNILPIVSKADHAHMAATVEYGKSKFTYDEGNDAYICPQGQLLKAYKPRKENAIYAGHKRYFNAVACINCPVKEKCTISEKGRTIQDRPFQRIADEVDKRTAENADMYKKRQRLAEHPFGTLKRDFGFTYFLTRGTESVRAESLMHFLIYNMKRVINIIGTKRLIGLLQG